MFNFLRSIRIDRLSFWLGFAAASLFWWLVVTVRPHWKELLQFFKKQFQATKQELQSSSHQRLHNDTLKYVQQLHLAAPLFSLDEILIPPRLLAPQLPVRPGGEPLTEDIASAIIPWIPEIPELATAYGAPSLTLPEALEGGVNLAIIGPPGSGKTTALAHLASATLRGETQHPNLQLHTPIFVHAANLDLEATEEHLAGALLPAVSKYSSTLSQSRLPKFVQTTLASERALLLIDGLDELPPAVLTATLQYIQQILQAYPKTRIVVSAAPTNLGTLPALGFVPLSMMVWDARQQAQFVQQWGQLWERHVDKEADENYTPIDPLLLNGWLLHRTSAATPLEFTLQTWATYAGDVRGPTLSDSLEAYIRRMSADISKGYAALERLAGQAILTMKPAFTTEEAQTWAREVLAGIIADLPHEDTHQDENSPPPKDITLPRVLPDLSSSGLLVSRTGDRLGFIHPLIQGYLAAQFFRKSHDTNVYTQREWPLRNIAVQFAAARQDIRAHVGHIITSQDDPLQYGAFIAASWLSEIPPSNPWQRDFLTQAAAHLRNESLPLPLRGRILAALAVTRDPNIATLFRHLLNAPQTSTRQLAALGSGYQRDLQAVELLIPLINDLSNVSRAACLALALIGTPPALEALASALLQGSEDTRRAAAEAFANHPEEGHPTLREAVRVDDILVRRAAIYGLQRVRQPWAMDILETMQIEDAQWVVKNAATQAYEELRQGNPRIPQPLQPPESLPWLISFAAEQGSGISAGEPALQMLLKAVSTGNPDEQLAALQYLQQLGYEKIFPTIYHAYLSGNDPDLQQAAYDILWHLAAAGVELPPLMKYGLG